MNQTQSLQDLLHLFPVNKQKSLTDIATHKTLPSLYSESIATHILDPIKHSDRISKLFSYVFPELNSNHPSIHSEDSFFIFPHKVLIECYLKYINHCDCSFAETIAALEYQKFRDDFSFEHPLLLIYIPGTSRTLNHKSSLTANKSPECYAVCLLHKSPKSLQDRIGYLHFIAQKLKKADKTKVHLAIADADLCYNTQSNLTYNTYSDPFTSFLCAYMNSNDSIVYNCLSEPEFVHLQDELLKLTKDHDILCQYIREEYQEMRASEESSLFLSKGLARGRADSILMLLSGLGPIPSELTTAIQEESNLPILSRWLKLSSQVASLQEFIEEM